MGAPAAGDEPGDDGGLCAVEGSHPRPMDGSDPPYTRSGMRVRVILDEQAFARLCDAAARRGLSVEEAAGEVVRLGLRRERVIAEGLAALDRLDREQEPIGEDEAMRIAVEEVRAMRAERRAERRP